MDFRKCTTFSDPPSARTGSINFLNGVHAKTQMEDHEESANLNSSIDVDVDLREFYFLIMHFLSDSPCQKTFRQLADELLEHKLLPRRYHAWYSRTGAVSGEEDDDGNSFNLIYDNLVKKYSHIEKNHLVKLLKQLLLMTSPPLRCMVGSNVPTAADVPTLLGTGSFSLLSSERNNESKQVRNLPSYLCWPHMQADQVRGLRLREIGGGFLKHHRAPSIRYACYAIAKPSVLVPKMQNKKKLRGHRDAVYCAIFDRHGQYVITGSDDRLVKIWSMETAFCLASCRGHEGDITDLSVNSNNHLVASASNDYSIRVWRLPDGLPISVLRGHTGAVTAIAFCPRPNAIFQLLSSSDDGTCRIWDARSSQCSPRVYVPKPMDPTTGKSISIPSASASSSHAVQRHQILCCTFNVSGTVFVTGSSDTFARVWNACKPSSDNPEEPSHEIDILAGHENDVNYVQFSGCAVASRSSPADTSIDDSLPKFKNYRFSHDSIVTCSRDGSAIIWIPRSRRSHVKIGRWIRAYHLKVPPPPMPPQPPRGGPRLRLLPTPRGVNMIVWSLDNRFVLAAIMDNRICVWNANDGSLVHSLAGHTASTYVLDVHPFNPRIAMSAGYDGKTILWDIWEGTPVREYEIDVRFKLVDGKFSQDGTSIVLSDDVGQIYLLSTGEGESQKDAKYDQFFLGDYRPLTQDAYGNVVDQETQLVPYRRNIQDTLCDSSMLPYAEPYQSMYQRRRLGALGIEWRPSSIKFVIGTDIGIGQEFQILPLPDLDVAFEPLPDYLDAMYWEPENDVMNDDNDSEYNVTEDNVSDDQICATDSASSDSECSEDNRVRRNHKDSTRRSKKKKPLLEVSFTSSGRRDKKRISEERDGISSRSKRYKKSKRASRRKCTEANLSRPQRVAARNAINNFSHITEDSADEEDEDGYSSTSESSFEESPIQREEHNENLFNEQIRHSAVDGSENKKKLVLKLSLNRRTIHSASENHTSEIKNQDNSASSFLIPIEGNPKDDRSLNQGSPSLSLVDEEFSDTHRKQSGVVEKPIEADNELKPFPSSSGVSLNWAKFKIRTSNANAVKEDGVCNKQDFGNEEKGSSSSLLCGTTSVTLQNSSKKKPITIKIKSSKSRGDSPKPLVNTSSHASSGASGERHISVEEENCLEFPTASNKYAESDHLTRSHVKCGGNSTDADLDTDAVRRSRSFKLNVTSQENHLNDDFETGVEYLQPCTSRGSGKSRKKDIDRFAQEGDVFGSRYTVKPRSSRKKGEGYGGGNRSGLVRSSEQIPKKLNWLLLLQQEVGYRYIPQLGDIVVYMRQGHQGYLESSMTSHSGPWVRFGNKIRAVEVCMVEDLKYTTVSGSGLSCCKLTLTFLDASRDLTGQKFQLTLSELIDFPDFIVEKTRFDVAMERNWRVRDKCEVWWRDESENGGQWWEGTIYDVRNKSGNFPGSPWERYLVKYDNDTVDHFHCPWELNEPNSPWEQPTLDFETKERISSCFIYLVQKASKDQDRYGILKLNEVAHKLDFQNRFPAPLSPDIIQARLQNGYYRNVKATKHDIGVMLSNAESYFLRNSELLRKMQRLSQWFDRALSEL